MKKHNNNTSPSSLRRCKCGRYITIAEDKAGIGLFGYTCPNCLNPHLGPESLTAEEYYNQIQRVFKN